MGRLDDKIAIVTGAASGIGAATARRVAAEGAHTVVADLNLDGAKAVTEEIRAAGGSATAVPVDLGDIDSVRAMVATAVDTYGGLDVLHNNAAATHLAARKDLAVLEADPAVWDDTMRINLRGTMQAGGNPFEGARSDEFPSPPLPPVYSSQLFAKAASELGYKPFPLPGANSSRAYTNPYGVRQGPCNMCGFCERFGCFLYSKASPQTSILPILANRPNLEVRTNSYVTRILLDKSRTRATGVLYVDEGGQEVEQPAELVVLSAFQFHNVRLLLMSGVGKPYDPATGQGVVGKNYAYQMVAGTAAFFKDDVEINPFIGAGAAGMMCAFEAGRRGRRVLLLDHGEQIGRASCRERVFNGV